MAGAVMVLTVFAAIVPTKPTAGLEHWRAEVKAAVAGCSVPKSRDEIQVCGRKDKPQPYRLPPAFRSQGFDPGGGRDSVSRERHRLMEGGASGIGSCSPVGAGGATGCLVRKFRETDQQYAH